MDLKEALLRADGFLRESERRGYFLCSVFSSIKNPKDDMGIKEWVLHLYGKDGALDCYVNDDGVAVEESQSVGEPAKLDVDRVKVTANDALSMSERSAAGAITILLSLHGSPPVWTINFFAANMSVTTVDIDARTGDVMREETTSVLRK